MTAKDTCKDCGKPNGGIHTRSPQVESIGDVVTGLMIEDVVMRDPNTTRVWKPYTNWWNDFSGWMNPLIKSGVYKCSDIAIAADAWKAATEWSEK